jgi:hypothetical protein
MFVPDLSDLMKKYADRGVKDWNNAGLAEKNRALSSLGHELIAVTTHDIHATIWTFGQPVSNLKFIPVPKVPKKSGIYPGFFFPIRRILPGGGEHAKFELVLTVTQKDCLAFRLEPPHGPPSAHRYSHVQMCRKLRGETFAPGGVLQWAPDRYPAFFMPMTDPVRSFLAMATALHGYYAGSSPTQGIEEIIKDIYSGQPLVEKGYLGILQGMFQ